jgi:hypothetical protein
MLLWTWLLIIHGLVAVALLGAITHQAVAVAMPVRQAAGSFTSRLRAVPATSYATAVVVLYLITAILGAWIYSEYRGYIRVPLEQLQYWKTHGAFEMKEHATAIGIAWLPAYWYYWTHPVQQDSARTRKWLTVLIAGIVWFSFLVGHVANNARGFGS